MATIEIMRKSEVIDRVDGEIHGPFGVHKEGRRWKVTHLATGFAVPYWFRTRARAVEYITKIARVRNDWYSTIWDIPESQKTELRRIAGECDGVYNNPTRSDLEKGRRFAKAMRPLNGLERH